jgi:hypothetical protein
MIGGWAGEEAAEAAERLAGLPEWRAAQVVKAAKIAAIPVLAARAAAARGG